MSSFPNRRSRYNRQLTRAVDEPDQTPPTTAAQMTVKRVRPVRIGVQGVGTSGSLSKRDHQDYRYPNFKVVRHPDSVINGRLYTDPDEPDAGTADGKPRRKIESHFNITVNTNRGVGPNAEKLGMYKAAFEAFAHHLAEPDNMLPLLRVGGLLSKKPEAEVAADGRRVKKRGPKKRDNSHFYDDILSDLWDSHTVNAGEAEFGEIKRRAHLHMHIQCFHYSNIQINVELFKQKACELMNPVLTRYGEQPLAKMPWCWVHMHEQKDWRDIAHQYAHKNDQGIVQQPANPKGRLTWEPIQSL